MTASWSAWVPAADYPSSLRAIQPQSFLRKLNDNLDIIRLLLKGAHELSRWFASRVPVLFTWASAARTTRYVYDLNSALVARVKIKQMADILVRTNAGSADIFAHSMGAFLVMEGLVDAEQTGYLGRRKTINHIILASPDIDIDLFRTQISLLPKSIRERMYILVSRDDSALRLSRRIAGGVPRVGAADTQELTRDGLTVIDLSEIDNSSSGSHSKFAGSPEVVKLIGAGLKNAGRFGEGNTPGLERILEGVPIRIVAN